MKETCPNCGTTFQGRVKAHRTLSQNARYWSLLIPLFAEWSGYEESPESAERIGKTPKDAAHEVLKSMFVPQVTETLPNGMTLTIMPSTSSFSIAEFSEFQDKVERFLVSQGIRLPADER